MSVGFALVLLVLVVLQGMLGMLTVTWLLKPLIVTGHLVGGLTTFALLLWLWLSMRARGAARGRLLRARGQPVAEGGGARACGPGSRSRRSRCRWRSAAGPAATTPRVACPDVPKCQDQWIPEADYEDAFVLWRGLGINYAGGVLDHPARVAIHFTHRVGARAWPRSCCCSRHFAALRGLGAGPRWAALAVLAALALQISIGVFMVLRAFPLELAAAHNAGRRAARRSHGAAEPEAPAGGRFSLHSGRFVGDRLNCRASTEASSLATPEPIVACRHARAGAASTS